MNAPETNSHKSSAAANREYVDCPERGCDHRIPSSDAPASLRFEQAGDELARSVVALALELPRPVFEHHKAVVDEYLAALRAVLKREGESDA